jgi:fatty-acyl-CoA synthase
MSLATAVDRHALARPRAIALVDAAHGTRISYAALAERSREIPIPPGSRVAVLAHGSARTFEVLVACSRVGATLVPLNSRLADPELKAILSACEPSLVLADETHAERLRGIGVDADDLHSSTGLIDRTRPIENIESLVMLFTSGTTGRPKGALLAERGIAANASSTCRAWEITEDDIGLVDAPLFHTGGLNVLATPLLYAGGTVVVAPRFDAELSAEIMVRERVTLAFGVPQMLERLAATDVLQRGAVRLWVTGGAPCPRSLLDLYSMQSARIVQGFGMTECGPNCFRPLADAEPGSIGVPTYDLEARLDETTGELHLRGPHVFNGYFRDDAATRAAFTADGWLKTGDVLRETPRGWFVVGRTKEMFISGGENVYPAEVESAIAQHPAVKECAVVAAPDPKWGESGVAFVITRDTAPTPSDLRAFVRTRLAGYKVPRDFVLTDDLPRTATGKIDKRSLEARARG